MREDYRVFDAHSHVGEWGKWNLKGRKISPFQNEFLSVKDLENYREKYDVDKQLVMTHYHPDLSITLDRNKLTLNLSSSSKVHGAIFFEPSKSDIDIVKDQASQPGIVALKTSGDAWQKSDYNPGSWSDSERKFMDDLMEFAKENSLPIHFHTGDDKSDPRKLFKLVEEYPENTYHMVHMGGTGGGHMAFVPRFLERLDDYSIYFDTCWARGFGVRWIARKLKKRNALDRMIFATDEPWGDFPSEYNKVKGLDFLDRNEKQKILYENAENLYLN